MNVFGLFLNNKFIKLRRGIIIAEVEALRGYSRFCRSKIKGRAQESLNLNFYG